MSDIALVAVGNMVETAFNVSELLNKLGYRASVINARFLKPFDDKKIIESINKTKNVITIEDGLLRSGLASTIKELIIENHLENIEIKSFGYDDTYVKQGSVKEIEELYHLDAKSIVKNSLKFDENMILKK